MLQDVDVDANKKFVTGDYYRDDYEQMVDHELGLLSEGKDGKERRTRATLPIQTATKTKATGKTAAKKPTGGHGRGGGLGSVSGYSPMEEGEDEEDNNNKVDEEEAGDDAAVADPDNDDVDLGSESPPEGADHGKPFSPAIDRTKPARVSSRTQSGGGGGAVSGPGASGRASKRQKTGTMSSPRTRSLPESSLSPSSSSSPRPSTLSSPKTNLSVSSPPSSSGRRSPKPRAAKEKTTDQREQEEKKKAEKKVVHKQEEKKRAMKPPKTVVTLPPKTNTAFQLSTITMCVASLLVVLGTWSHHFPGVATPYFYLKLLLEGAFPLHVEQLYSWTCSLQLAGREYWRLVPAASYLSALPVIDRYVCKALQFAENELSAGTISVISLQLRAAALQLQISHSIQFGFLVGELKLMRFAMYAKRIFVPFDEILGKGEQITRRVQFYMFLLLLSRLIVLIWCGYCSEIVRSGAATRDNSSRSRCIDAHWMERGAGECRRSHQLFSSRMAGRKQLGVPLTQPPPPLLLLLLLLHSHPAYFVCVCD